MWWAAVLSCCAVAYGTVGAEGVTLRTFASVFTGLCLTAGMVVVAPVAQSVLSPNAVQSLYAVGSGGSGQLGNGGTYSTFVPLPVSSPLTGGALSVDANLTSSIAVAVDGSVWTWGANRTGFLGTGQGFPGRGGVETSAIPVSPQLPAGTSFQQVAAGMNHALALSTAGQVFAWGWNGHGQLGTGANGPDPSAYIPDDSSDVPLAVPVPGTVKLIGASNYRSVAVTTTDQVYAWGINEYTDPIPGATGRAVNTPSLVSLPPFSGRITKVLVGNYATFLVTSGGQVIAWGDNPFGQFGIGQSTWNLRSATILPHQNVKDVASAGTTTYFLLGDKVWAAGYNGFGQLGYGTTPRSSSTLLPVALPAEPVVAIYGGSAQGFAVTDNGNIYTWGSDTEGSSGTGSSGIAWRPIPAFTGDPGFLLELAVSSHTLAVFGESPYQPPTAAPTNIQATLSGTSIVITWDPPSRQRFPIIGYTVSSGIGMLRCETVATSCRVTGMAKGTPYTFTVTARNRYGAGPTSAPSNPITYVTAPDVPRDVEVSILRKKRRQAQVTWRAPASDGGSPVTTYSWRWYNNKTRTWSADKETPGLRARFRWPSGTSTIKVQVWASNTQGASPKKSDRLRIRS